MNDVDKLLDEAQKAVEKDERIKAEQSIKPFIIKKNNPFITLKTFVLIMIIILLTGGFVYVKYYYSPIKLPKKIVQKTSNKKLPTPTPGPITLAPEGNFHTLKLNNTYTFQYPLNWNVVDKIPEAYKTKPFGTVGWKEGKMFGDCKDAVLQNSNADSSLIVIETQEQKNYSDKHCWSNGDFSDNYLRQITINDNTVNIKVSRWKISPYEENIEIQNPVWNGDIFQQYTFVNQDTNTRVVLGLYYQDGKDYTAELAFNQILSSFRFLKPDEGQATVDWKTYSERSQNIQIRYPSNWTLLTQPNTYNSTNNIIYIRKDPNDDQINNIKIEISNGADENTLNSTATSAQSLPEWKDQPEIEPTTVGEENALILKGEANGMWMVKIFVLRGGNLFSITWKDNLDKKEEWTFNTIKSTFKFIY
ncbi:MAG: hypothetical protein A2857_02105 [Candidatus Levybacteria bacterium RIFCSPHIGHO2_01_FULL_36_15]|nr:MAG: hypothetical protein A2857_02105 [Candidatus Levybacteria bacterium RIFCSPHIGHO2_01_FULL_36_15]OGH38780.1 MAG: hypothetical protein A2905_04465 [Candidatus Levybacteria bacterium RIFCSPLOWO2_01_FULL_36_10]